MFREEVKIPFTLPISQHIKVRLVTTPHIGGNSMESVLSMGRSCIRSLINYRAGIL